MKYRSILSPLVLVLEVMVSSIMMFRPEGLPHKHHLGKAGPKDFQSMCQDPAKPLERQALLMIKSQPTHITAESACQGQAALPCPSHTHGTVCPWIITGGILIEGISLALQHTQELLDLVKFAKPCTCL